MQQWIDTIMLINASIDAYSHGKLPSDYWELRNAGKIKEEVRAMKKKQMAINNYPPAYVKFGKKRYEVTLIVEEQNDETLESLLGLIGETLYKAYPLMFRKDMEMRYIEI